MQVVLAASSLLSWLHPSPTPCANHELASVTSVSSASIWPYQTFVTQPTFFPPVFEVESTREPVPGYLFLSPKGPGTLNRVASIMTEDGELVWMSPSNGSQNNLKLATVKRQPVILYWEGDDHSAIGHGWGGIHILDLAYKELYHVKLDYQRSPLDNRTLDSYLDPHEAWITQNDTILVAGYNTTNADLTSVGGPEDGWLIDCVIFELDIDTNEVLWSWSAAAHHSRIPLTASYTPPSNLTETGNGTVFSNPWDWFHINSIMDYGRGFIVSARNTCSVYYIDKSTGEVIWILEGQSGGDFVTDGKADFCFQHHARVIASTPTNLILTLYNNNNSLPAASNISTGLTLDINTKDRTVTTLSDLYEPDHIITSSSQGNFQTLPNFHKLINHGSWPEVVEYDVEGNVVYRATFGTYMNTSSYRVFRHDFIGRPRYPPDIVACRKPNGKVQLHMSWNGATDYLSWNIYCAGSPLPVNIPRTGFETAALLDCGQDVLVEALFSDGAGVKSTVVGAESISRCVWLPNVPDVMIITVIEP